MIEFTNIYLVFIHPTSTSMARIEARENGVTKVQSAKATELFFIFLRQTLKEIFASSLLCDIVSYKQIVIIY